MATSNGSDDGTTPSESALIFLGTGCSSMVPNLMCLINPSDPPCSVCAQSLSIPPEKNPNYRYSFQTPSSRSIFFLILSSFCGFYGFAGVIHRSWLIIVKAMAVTSIYWLMLVRPLGRRCSDGLYLIGFQESILWVYPVNLCVCFLIRI